MQTSRFSLHAGHAFGMTANYANIYEMSVSAQVSPSGSQDTEFLQESGCTRHITPTSQSMVQIFTQEAGARGTS